MKKMILILLLVPAALYAEMSARHFTLEELQGTAIYLGIKIEKPKTTILKCDPSPEEAKAWLGGQLHSLLDDIIHDETARFARNPSQMVKRAKGCHTTCSCNVYAAILTASEDSMAKHPMYKELKRVVEKESKREDAMACAKKLGWFCGSALETSLRGTPPAGPGNGPSDGP
jgi:hypothetical protein